MGVVADPGIGCFAPPQGIAAHFFRGGFGRLNRFSPERRCGRAGPDWKSHLTLRRHHGCSNRFLAELFLRTGRPEGFVPVVRNSIWDLRRWMGLTHFRRRRTKARLSFLSSRQDNAYFPLAQKAMINLQVDNLDALLGPFADRGCGGRPGNSRAMILASFGWLTDPAGNRVELWQPITTEGRRLILCLR